ncbi:MAG: PD40 domain-containing protein [Deltaproteobacteria bacterium]|nr:PD40 domain-containing protein [Deltaproteobacteria bacterium]
MRGTRAPAISNGEAGDDESIAPATDGEGALAAFESAATNLVSGDTNGKRDIFLRDIAGNTTTRISLAVNGAESNGDSSEPAMSADGRYVAFTSAASNLVESDGNNAIDVFVYDRQSGATARASVSSAGGESNGDSYGASLSEDGRYVAFTSTATNLTSSAPGGGLTHVYVRDLSRGKTFLVSNGTRGQETEGNDEGASISADGHTIAFQSSSSILVPSDSNTRSDVFVVEVVYPAEAVISSVNTLKNLVKSFKLSSKKSAKSSIQESAAAIQSHIDFDPATIAVKDGSKTIEALNTSVQKTLKKLLKRRKATFKSDKKLARRALNRLSNALNP